MVAVVAGMVAVVAKMLVKKVMVAGIVVLVRHFNTKNKTNTVPRCQRHNRLAEQQCASRKELHRHQKCNTCKKNIYSVGVQ